MAARATASGVALFPGTIAGISLAAHWGGGLYWLAPTVLLGIAGGSTVPGSFWSRSSDSAV